MLNYELELEKMVDILQKEKPRRVCIQLPDGLKPKAQTIRDYLKGKTDAVVMFWAGSCYGACDIPYEVKALQVDLIIQFGHSKKLRMGQRIFEDF